MLKDGLPKLESRPPFFNTPIGFYSYGLKAVMTRAGKFRSEVASTVGSFQKNL